jgi:hypothetical protein
MHLDFNETDQLLIIPFLISSEIIYLKEYNDNYDSLNDFIFAKEKSTINQNLDRILSNGKFMWRKGDYEGRAYWNMKTCFLSVKQSRNSPF